MNEAITSSRTKKRKKERDAEVPAQYEASGDIDPMIAKKMARRARKFVHANSSLGNDPAEEEGIRLEGRDLKRKAEQMMVFAQEKIRVANDTQGKATKQESPKKIVSNEI
uniref:Uncharacterized protein n=1 Tax=Tetranychus urticae TaxID=32264 RepID=T1L0M6_TETUR